MIWEQVLHMLNRKALLGILLLLMLLLVSGCGKTKDVKISSDNVVTADFENSTKTEEANVDTEEINTETTEFDSEVTESADYEERNSEMKLYVNDNLLAEDIRGMINRRRPTTVISFCTAEVTLCYFTVLIPGHIQDSER